MVRGAGEPLIFTVPRRPANAARPRPGVSEKRCTASAGAAPGTPMERGAADRNSNRLRVTAERSDAASGQRRLTADVTLAPLGPGDYVIELSVTDGSQQKKTLVAIRVTQ